ncbi:MAG: LPS export ABC transporter periplasmic protein LptC [Saprospiraceae bacterium]|nr:LPS export ABC transporter periplasmic protein LptC [Saprospiraceae bacterium]
MRYLFVILLTGLFLVSSCRKEVPEVDEALMTLLKRGVEVGDSVQILYSDSARLKVMIEAPVMYQETNRRYRIQTFPKGIYVEFYDDQGQLMSTLRANYAQRREQDRQVIVRDDVVYESVQGDKLETSELIWSENDRLVSTDKPYRLRRANGDLSNGLLGFTANESFTYFKSHSVYNRFLFEETKKDTVP